jgi:DNA-binding MarR family transcriptional regulator
VTDPVTTGARVLAALEAGREARQRALTEARAPIIRAVRRELDHDIIAGKPPRGRASRIARRLQLHPKRVKRILDSLFSVSNSLQSNGATQAPKD